MISTLLLVAVQQATPSAPYALWGDKCDARQPQAVFVFFSPQSKVIAFARDGEMRWYDSHKNRPVRTRQLLEVPKRDMTSEEKAENDRLIKMHEGMFGDIPYNFFTHLSVMPFGDHSSFYITDLRDKLYQYSSDTGELERKVHLKYNTPLKGSVLHRFLDKAGKRLVFKYSFPNMVSVCFDLETGKELSRYPTDFVSEDIRITPDGERIYITRGNKLFAHNPATGAQIGTAVELPKVSTASIVVSPDSKRVAYTGYDKNGEFLLNAILNLETGKVTEITPTLRQFFVDVWTPDGKYVGVRSDGYLHFADAETGKHAFSYTSGYPDLWNRSGTPQFTQDSSKMTFVPELGADIQTNYFLVVDMNQPKDKPVIKIGP